MEAIERSKMDLYLPPHIRSLFIYCIEKDQAEDKGILIWRVHGLALSIKHFSRSQKKPFFFDVGEKLRLWIYVFAVTWPRPQLLWWHCWKMFLYFKKILMCVGKFNITQIPIWWKWINHWHYLLITVLLWQLINLYFAQRKNLVISSSWKSSFSSNGAKL